MNKTKEISVVLPIKNEELNIRRFIQDIENLNIVDEIIAVDNGSTDSSAAEIRATGAKYVFEKNPGYGAALISGLRAATKDYVITVEPDGTFRASDIQRFLAYVDDFPVIFGTRTNTATIFSGAFMPRWVRFGNWLCAKSIEVLFNGPCLTDVGCTFKLVERKALSEILPTLRVHKSHFSPEFMIRAIQTGFPCVEIPVAYLPRVGQSKITGGNVIRTIKLGIIMFFFILKLRLRGKPSSQRMNSIKAENSGIKN